MVFYGKVVMAGRSDEIIWWEEYYLAMVW